jgi:hypothetical protein
MGSALSLAGMDLLSLLMVVATWMLGIGCAYETLAWVAGALGSNGPLCNRDVSQGPLIGLRNNRRGETGWPQTGYLRA